eukprot:COSAG06_NODE_20779_length_782_cov_0.606149_1_plen_26_part_10
MSASVGYSAASEADACAHGTVSARVQ